VCSHVATIVVIVLRGIKFCSIHIDFCKQHLATFLHFKLYYINTYKLENKYSGKSISSTDLTLSQCDTVHQLLLDNDGIMTYSYYILNPSDKLFSAVKKKL